MKTNSNSKNIFLIMIILPLLGAAVQKSIWPAAEAEKWISSVYIIPPALLIEFFFFKKTFRLNNKNAILYSMLANLMSGILGFFARPFYGFLYEVTIGNIVNAVFNLNTYNSVSYFFIIFNGAAINTILEIFCIKVLWKRNFGKIRFMWLYSINAASIFAGVLLLIFTK